MTNIEENIRLWQERIGNASSKWGGAAICGVTKTVDTETINRAYPAGISVIGENRVQELLGKLDTLDPRFEIHLIGQLQTNKVRQVLGAVSTIQSLDRIPLAEEISRRATAKNLTVKALVQINIGREPQKGGLDEDELVPFLKVCSTLGGLQIDGLMAVMPEADDPEDIRPLFKRMRGWFDRLRDADLNNVQMNTLSMGMTHDCIVAAEEGATMVRLGRALFGARNYNLGGI